jgi:hypothetical protein
MWPWQEPSPRGYAPYAMEPQPHPISEVLLTTSVPCVQVITLSAAIGTVLSLVSQLVLPVLIPLFCSSQEVVALTAR